MDCDQCKETIGKNEEREHLGQVLCEDCYMDALSPARACDPWAVYSAQTLAKESGGRLELSPIQTKILEIIKETEGIEPHLLVERLQIRPADLERDIAALRHMEKIRAELRQGRKFIVLW